MSREGAGIKSKAELEKFIREEKSAVLVVNTYSRRDATFFFGAVDELARRGITVTASYPVRHPERLHEINREAIKLEGRLVIVGGGDGTISSIVDYFADEDVVLGLLPLGTGNGFARTLRISLRLEGAVGVIVGHKVVNVNLEKVNADYLPMWSR